MSDRTPPNRRAFLRTLAAGSAGVAATLAASGSPGVAFAREPGSRGPSLRPTHSGGSGVSEPYWEAVKARFPIREGLVPMNAANLCPAPREVIEAVEGAGRDVDADVSFQNRAKYDELRERVRERLAAYLGADADEIALVRNTSEGNNTVVGGLALGPGDEVVVFDQNHPTCNVAWDVRAARHGFSVRRVSVAAPPSSPEEVLHAFTSAFTPRTRAVAFSDVSNTTGVRVPVREVCAEARRRGIHSHVDGAQSFGAEPLALHALGCDSYATSAHKWFMGPKEVGVLYVRSDRVGEIWPLAVGVGWGGGAETTVPGARKFETLGQRNDAVFAGLEAAIALHEEIGPDRVGARIRELAGKLKSRLAELGAELVTSPDPALSGGVVVVRFPGVEASAIHERLYREHGIAGAPTGGLRLCPHVYNTRADVVRALEAVAAEVA
jgi:isopenicillin-N epimerase